MPSSDSYLFTSESVTEGHPDKVADQISDAILDLVLEHDTAARVACETLVVPGKIILAGEIASSVAIEASEYERVARETVRAIGYDRPEEGFDADQSEVLSFIHRQSADISAMVDDGGAGDQGLMFGYACTETGELMPLPVMLAHRLTRRLAQVRHEAVLPFLRPDGKSQVTVEFRDGRPRRVRTVAVATQHEEDTSLAEVRAGVEEAVVRPVLPDELVDEQTEIRVNKRGRFVTGGPQGDSGLTGRKIIVDTYGGSAPHGGGAFSGKDPTKVDRSASYMARYIAKNLVAAGLAERVDVQLAYVIGDREPVSVHVDTYGSGKLPNQELERLVRKEFPLAPAEIVRTLDLQRPIYRATAAYGHFGREEADFSWERVDRAEQLRDLATAEAGSPAA